MEGIANMPVAATADRVKNRRRGSLAWVMRGSLWFVFSKVIVEETMHHRIIMDPPTEGPMCLAVTSESFRQVAV